MEGDGEATVVGRSIELHPGMLLLIEAGEAHRIEKTGSASPTMDNLYALPAC